MKKVRSQTSITRFQIVGGATTIMSFTTLIDVPMLVISSFASGRSSLREQLSSVSDDPFCNNSCRGDADCNQATGCMICDYNHIKYHQLGSLEKNCQTRSHTCGGPPSHHCHNTLPSVTQSHMVSSNTSILTLRTWLKHIW